MHISHVAGNLSHANEESQPRHVITLLISTQASSGKVRREELKNFTFHSLFLCQIGVTVYSRRRRLQFSALDLRRSQRAPGTLLWTSFFGPDPSTKDRKGIGCWMRLEGSDSIPKQGFSVMPACCDGSRLWEHPYPKNQAKRNQTSSFCSFPGAVS